MAFLWKSKLKSPQELVSDTSSAIKVIQENVASKQTSKAMEEVGKNLAMMKAMACGSGVVSTEVAFQLAHEVCSGPFIQDIIANMAVLEFQATKDAIAVFVVLINLQQGATFTVVDHISGNPALLDCLVDSYAIMNAEDTTIPISRRAPVALHCGIILRECIRHEVLADILLRSTNFAKFFQCVVLPYFDVASDAFFTFKTLLTSHPHLCGEFLFSNYNEVFHLYNSLLTSTNYIARRLSLQLLGNLLLDRSNQLMMKKYITSSDNLKTTMRLLADRCRGVQFEAFHVFKFFVANPEKPDGVVEILLRNQQELVEYLSEFQSERKDQLFLEEREYLIGQIQVLKAKS